MRWKSRVNIALGYYEGADAPSLAESGIDAAVGRGVIIEPEGVSRLALTPS